MKLITNIIDKIYRFVNSLGNLFIYFISKLNLKNDFLKKKFVKNINLYNSYDENYLNFVNNILINCNLISNEYVFTKKYK